MIPHGPSAHRTQAEVLGLLDEMERLLAELREVVIDDDPEMKAKADGE